MPNCDLCGREPLKGNAVSHSNAKTIRRQKLNLQSKKINGKKMRVCARCIKTLIKPARKKNKKSEAAK
ncbi:MAG: 50S ribosomal protein L28 [Candidatus Buchananbacteria bacterium RIFCSPHIGHO2_02_FULL_45_11b]|uniref:Large ribosomal subunit protein bL28 n=4 Tax=Candidatus Buchananiibacteriota TaxID=1817903 RepID=A0A1G1YMC9_9BACT|nr:MAG: 50S ribosomal protein L28 [Candidatus Buchananbacteria bacterium RIFCSPHIGHO2_01_FULL_46_12]OGY50509.1 MAG: 50S ribosomal protein L28 [Candidatus Buchananbacteria bacterium RIFCSPHIGHO2_02_FULL_45_11b]OGY53441.1 MAG: 50S ribosomal protein L28 [Candidatus Buchananbacteria bacterium RIFCSPLOWO2_01_FULL_45_31]OGY57082.1 MAG: 50S ribosomal protein L28 [Candidatus Buchananbacteria bacterium RIFCSPLOWO2_02_FULL_46_11b]